MRDAVRFLCLVLLGSFLVSAGACGNVETGASDAPKPSPGADDDDDDGGMGDDDDDDGGVNPTPTPGSWDPGPIPQSLGGFAAFGRFVDVHSDDFVGMVNFFPVAAPVPPTLAEVWNDFPEMDMDSCKRVYPSSVGVASNILPPSAGTITLEGPAGSITLTNLMGASYMSIWNDVSKFVPNSTYMLKATGAQIEPFEIPLLSPGLLTSLTPNPVGPNPFPIPRGEPFLLQWESIPDGRPIYLYLRQKDSPETEEWTYMCKLTDDGEFAVPTSVLSNFGATVPPFVTEEWRDKLELRRSTYTSFEPQGAMGPILTGFESGWYANVEFQ